VSRRPLVISHRTQMGSMPENTIAGIEAALAVGADGVEVDVRVSSDGVAVLHHDETLERTAGDARALAGLTAARLARLHVADPHGTVGPQPIPTLERALEAVGGRCLLVIELKEPRAVRAVARLVRRAGAAAWCWVWAFDPTVALASRRALPEVPVSLLVAPGTDRRFGYDSPFDLAVRSGFAGVSLERGLADAVAVDGGHRRGLAVYSWTADEPEALHALAAADIDAICSNYPERARRVLRP
jgi:glycerophosphoryl diester phosphodiesterase